MILGQNQTCAFFCGLQLDLDHNIPGFSFYISDRFFFWFLFKKIKETNYWEHNRETIDSVNYNITSKMTPKTVTVIGNVVLFCIALPLLRV